MSWYKKKSKTIIDKFQIAAKMKLNKNASLYEAIAGVYPHLDDNQVINIMNKYDDEIKKIAKNIKYITSEEKKLEKQMKNLSKTNLDLIKEHSTEINKLLDSVQLEAWMADKIATARNDLNDVRMGLTEKNEDY